MRIRTLVGIGVALAAAVALVAPRGDVAADEAGKVKLVGGDQKYVGDLVEADIKALNDLLSANPPKKPQIKQARVLAIVIGLNAEAAGNKAVRAHAGKVVEALADEKLAEAKEAAKALVSAKGDGAASGDIIKSGLFDKDPTTNDWDRDLAMQLFKTSKAGGLGIEGNIKNKWVGKAPVGKDVDVARAHAQKAAVIGLALQQMGPPKGKPDADWKKYAADMTKAADEAAAAAKKNDGKAMVAAFNQLDKACTNCHEKYK